jgi:hypothetical protein
LVDDMGSMADVNPVGQRRAQCRRQRHQSISATPFWASLH